MSVQIQGSGTCSQTALTVIVGPIKIDRGEVGVSVLVKTVAGGSTTPTACKLQYSNLEAPGSTDWVDVTSGSVTAGTGANAVAEVTKLQVIGRWLRLVAGGAFDAGDATAYLWGIERKY